MLCLFIIPSTHSWCQIFSWGIFTIYLATFSYLADWYLCALPCSISSLKQFLSSYGPFASSALAGQSLSRESGKYQISTMIFTHILGNLMSTILPLFTDQMFRTLGYKWPNTLFGLVAFVMLPIPFVRLPACSMFRCVLIFPCQAFFFYGPIIRRRSRFSRVVLEAEKKISTPDLTPVHSLLAPRTLPIIWFFSLLLHDSHRAYHDWQRTITWSQRDFRRVLACQRIRQRL